MTRSGGDVMKYADKLVVAKTELRRLSDLEQEVADLFGRLFPIGTKVAWITYHHGRQYTQLGEIVSRNSFVQPGSFFVRNAKTGKESRRHAGSFVEHPDAD